VRRLVAKRFCSETTLHQSPAPSVSPERKLKYPQYVEKLLLGKNQNKKITSSVPKEQDAASIYIPRETPSSRELAQNNVNNIRNFS